MIGTGAFGKLFKGLRIRHGKTLRQLCRENGFEPATISRIERGLLPAPRSPVKLGDYARAIGLQPRTTQWREFFYTAAIEAGRLPRGVLDDKELLGKLPVLLCATRKRSQGRRDLDALVEQIRRT